MTKTEVFEKIQSVIVEALGVEDSEVSSDASLARDLGAESLDFPGIVYLLEQEFSIEIPREEVFATDLLQDPKYLKQGKFTEEGILELKRRFPATDFSKLEQANYRVIDTFTVGMIEDYLMKRVG